MESLKESIEALEGLKKWMDNNLVKRKMWVDNCKNKIKSLEQEIASNKKALKKLSKGLPRPSVDAKPV
jgi:uncharacterized coiled-coil DUF342 family protein